ncbi:hypothetical protein KW782_02250 [Candidatus Parcubacteria bacterium]|nr:hypothetical protein [Candidatus Parcubacteria bacterium]
MLRIIVRTVQFFLRILKSEKLVRDKFEDGRHSKPVTRIATDAEIPNLLDWKILEEVTELLACLRAEKLQDAIGEFGDVYDVLDIRLERILSHLGLHRDDFEKRRRMKSIKRGEFNERIVLIT